MSFQVNKGLFMLDDFMDCHAILGVSVDAKPNEIRKRYLKISRRLHPDTFPTGDPGQAFATQLFAKLVSPAYSTLSQKREFKEYMLLIQLKGKQAIQQKVQINQLGELAQQLAAADNAAEHYHQMLQTLTTQQYGDLSQSPPTLEVLQQSPTKIGQLSELNLVYLMRRESQGQKPTASRPVAATPTSAAPTPAASAPTNNGAGDTGSVKRSSAIDNYLRRAEEYMAKTNYAQAILELRDAIRFAPNDSRCHSLMGMVYLKQKQVTMAKVSIKRALELNPKDPIALKAKQQLQKLGQTLDSGSHKSAASSTSSRPKKGTSGNTKEQGGGFLGGIFGGKRK
jgi:curved DNA-binding protein CbpA